MSDDLSKMANELQIKSEALENSLNGFDIVNAEGLLIYANKAYLNMWGYDDASEVIGHSPSEHCADPNTPKLIIEQLRSKGDCHLEFMAKRKDGSLFPVLMWARIAYDSDGNEIYPTTSIDITERKNYEGALRQAKEAAEKANELKSTFLANMSHEIRTPLGAMLGFAELLRNPSLNESQRREYLDILARNGEQLLVIINDILDLSKVEAGHLKLEHEPVHTETLVNDVLSLWQLKASDKNLTLAAAISLDVPYNFTADATRLKQILTNLVGNAIKFTLEGSIHLSVTCEKDSLGTDWIYFNVKDTGIGIPADKVDHVFEMFAQADESMTRKFGGTGLGLALSRRLARVMGGEISVLHSEVHRGTTFSLKLPLHDESLIKKPAVTLSARNDLREPLEFSGLRVLVVDDFIDNQRLLMHHLTARGAEVQVAGNGLEAVEKVLEAHFDLILMDIQMPLMDGYAATAKIRQRGLQIPSLP